MPLDLRPHPANDFTLSTPRLLLRFLQEDDLPYFTALNAQPNVALYLGTGKPRTVEESAAWFAANRAAHAELGIGQLAAVEKATGMLVGRCGLSLLERFDGPGGVEFTFGRDSAPNTADKKEEVLELGYVIGPSRWGMGLASEAAAAVRDHAFEHLKAPRLVSLIRPHNAASIRVARRVGFTHLESARYGALPVEIYGAGTASLG